MSSYSFLIDDAKTESLLWEYHDHSSKLSERVKGYLDTLSSSEKKDISTLEVKESGVNVFYEGDTLVFAASSTKKIKMAGVDSYIYLDIPSDDVLSFLTHLYVHKLTKMAINLNEYKGFADLQKSSVISDIFNISSDEVVTFSSEQGIDVFRCGENTYLSLSEFIKKVLDLSSLKED